MHSANAAPLSILFLLLASCGDKSSDSASDHTGQEGDTDTDSDTDTDTDTDTNPWPLSTADWSHCPDADSYVGDTAWGTTLQATADAVYCGSWSEERTLEEELTSQSRLRIVEGDWSMPLDDGEHDLTLPLCLAFPENRPQPEIDGTGTTSVSNSTWSDTTYTYLTGEQGFADVSLSHTVVLVSDKGDAPAPTTADGSANDAETGAGFTFVLHDANGSPFDESAITFITCGDTGWTRNLHTVTFDGGEVSLELWLGDNTVETAVGSFSLAEGTLDGTTFRQDKDFQLIYRPDHHHFGRHFAVIFDEPIGDACALRIEDLDGIDDVPTGSVFLTDCDLTPIETRTVTAETFTLE